MEGPTTPPAPTRAQRALVPRRPAGDLDDARACARAALGPFVDRAFRRPVTPDEVERYVDLVVEARRGGETFEQGLRAALAAALVSPHFLYGRDAEKQEKLRRIDRFHVEQLATLLDGLARTREGDGTLLDRTLVVFGSGIGDGDRHNHDDLPILLCGRGGGVASGRHVRFAAETPLCGLYLWLLRRAGVAAGSFGDATRPLDGLA